MKRRKTHTDIITGIDVGSTAVRVCVGQFVQSADMAPSLQIVGAVEVLSEGVQKGVITSIEDTVSAVSNALERAEKMVGAPIDHVWVGVSGTQTVSQESKGVIAISRTDGEITEEDVDRAVDAAKAVATPLNYEILHVLPRTFAVDGQTGIKDPVGMTGIRLEVDTKIIHGTTSHVKNLSKVVYRAGVDIDDFVLAVLAGGEVVANSRQKELGCVVINIGGPTTSLVVYEEGDVLHTAALPIGSAHITNDLALGLKTSIEVAERVKVEYGHCISRLFHKKDMVDIADLGAEKSELISKYFIAQIIEARICEIFERIDVELKKINRSALLPAGALFIGGGSKLNGLTDCAKEQLRLPAQLGYPLHIESISDKVNDIAFAPVIGMVKWGAHLSSETKRKPFAMHLKGQVAEKLKGIFKSLMP